MGHGPLVSAVLAVAAVGTARACTLEVQFQFAPGDYSEPARFSPTTQPDLQVAGSQRPVYLREDGGQMLHHWSDPDEGHANWILTNPTSAERQGNSGWVSISSWAVTPQQAVFASPLATWQSNSDKTGNRWRDEPAPIIRCAPDSTDHTLFLELDGGFRDDESSGAVAAHLLPGYYVATGHVIDDWPVLRVVSAASGAGQPPVWLIRRTATNPATNAATHTWSLEQGGHGTAPDSAANVVWLASDPSATAATLCTGAAHRLSWTARGGRPLAAHAISVRCEADGDVPGAIHRALRPAPPPTAVPGAWTSLSNGHGMPLVGLGTGAFEHTHEEAAIRGALREGYVLLDSATEYHNERLIGRLIREPRTGGAAPQRSDVFLSTKLWYTELGYRDSVAGVRKSLARLGTSHIDLQFLHWPQCHPHISWMDCAGVGGGTWAQSWRALERLYAEGIARSIAVSNFDPSLLDQLLEQARVPPHVLQNHAAPTRIPHNEIAYCRAHQIQFQAYSSLRGALGETGHPQMALVEARARAEGRSVTEVALRWLLELGVAIIPRSAQSKNRVANLALPGIELSRATREQLGLPKARAHGEL